MPSPSSPRPRRQSTPLTRRAATKAKTEQIRRKYRINTARRVKLLPAEVPHVEQMVVILKLANYSRVDIAKIIGISRDQVADILALPKIEEQIVYLRAKIPAAALELLENFMIEAVMTLADVMRTTPDDKIRIQAAESVLDRGGVVKISKQEQHRLNEEKITVTDDGLLDRLREASPEIQERAAQAIEELEKLLGEAAQESANEPLE